MSIKFYGRNFLQGVVVTLVAVFALAVGGGGVAGAEPRTGLLQFSRDGLTWVDDPSPVPGWQGTLIPGREIERTYYVRNNDSQPGVFTVEVGEFAVGRFGIFSVRTDIDGIAGSSFVYYGESQTSHEFGPAVQVGTILASTQLAPGQVARVTDRIGIPAEVGNETTNQSLTPAIGWNFLLDEEPEVPEPPTCDVMGSSGGSSAGSGSAGAFGSESGSTSGSADYFSFLCAITGSASGSTAYGS